MTCNDTDTTFVHNPQTCSLTVYVNFCTFCGGGSVTQLQSIVTVTEGEEVSLQCNYTSSSYGNDYLFWYRHYPNKAPEYILSTDTNNRIKDQADFANERFSTNVDHIANVLIGDSAVYYCAKRPTLLPSCGGTVQKLLCLIIIIMIKIWAHSSGHLDV
uniref:Ig-like domain-containing protein n=1 Tax=Callorhinchus milii TaxID=7868 RepID=A0A4W3IY51_CALMI